MSEPGATSIRAGRGASAGRVESSWRVRLVRIAPSSARRCFLIGTDDNRPGLRRLHTAMCTWGRTWAAVPRNLREDQRIERGCVSTATPDHCTRGERRIGERPGNVADADTNDATRLGRPRCDCSIRANCEILSSILTRVELDPTQQPPARLLHSGDWWE